MPLDDDAACRPEIGTQLASWSRVIVGASSLGSTASQIMSDSDYMTMDAERSSADNDSTRRLERDRQMYLD